VIFIYVPNHNGFITKVDGFRFRDVGFRLWVLPIAMAGAPLLVKKQLPNMVVTNVLGKKN